MILTAACGTALMLAAARRTGLPGDLRLKTTAGLLALTALFWFVLRAAPRVPRTAVISAALTATAWWTIALTPGRSDAPAARTDLSYWTLPSGSHLAYIEVPASTGPATGAPVLLLHGGPGISEMTDLVGMARDLHLPDADVYVYDQVGAGSSSRLADPTHYGVDRDVADLESIRHLLHAETITLVGHSYGGYLAASYAAAHPNRVTQVALISPQPISHHDHSSDRATSRLSTVQRLPVLARGLAPRALLTYALARLAPRLGHAVVGDKEADAQNDQFLRRTQDALHCRTGAPATTPRSGFYALQAGQGPISTSREQWLKARLAHVHTEALIIKGSCDYLSWESALEYQKALTGSRIAYIRGAGHNILGEQTTQLETVLRTFLRHGLVPDAWESTRVPSSYRGPVSGLAELPWQPQPPL